MSLLLKEALVSANSKLLVLLIRLCLTVCYCHLYLAPTIIVQLPVLFVTRDLSLLFTLVRYFTCNASNGRKFLCDRTIYVRTRENDLVW
jgi:hypothetical protein